MNDSKLVRYLLSLDTADHKPLLKFAEAGLVHEDMRISRLIEWLLSKLESAGSSSLSKTLAFEYAFEKKKYNDVHMRVLMTKTLQTVFAFISFREAQNDPMEQQERVISHLLNRNQNELAEKRIIESGNDFQKAAIKNQKYYLHQFEMEEHRCSLMSRLNQDYDFDAIFHVLDMYHFYQKLKYCCIRLNNKYIFRKSIDPAFLDDIVAHLQKKNFEDNPAIFCYSHAVLLQVTDDPVIHWNAFQETLETRSREMDPDDLRILSKLAENFCIRQINKGLGEYYEVLYQLMTVRLGREQEVSAAEFKNFVTVCLRSGKTKEVQAFLKKNRLHIYPADVRDDAVNYANARIHFYLKEYPAVLKLLQQVNYFDEFYKIDSKKLLIQTFYELKEWDSLESAMNAFRVFIHRNKSISEVHKLNNQNFINLLFQLIPIREGNSKKLLKLRNTVTKTEALAEREWLLQKMTNR